MNLDELLREIYQRCDVSNNRTDNPLNEDEFIAKIKALVVDSLPKEMSEDLIAIALSGKPKDAREDWTPQESHLMARVWNKCLGEIRSIWE